ncbi:MAG: RNA pyrophosphohydrolase [Alphaproteobacteria bacterium]
MTQTLDLPYRKSAGLCIVSPTKMVLCGKRVGDKRQYWQMPQGGIDDGEDPKTAGLRELTEETGIPATAVLYLTEHPLWLRYDWPPMASNKYAGQFKGQEQKWLLLRYSGALPNPALAKDVEFADIFWATPDMLLAHCAPFRHETYWAVFRHFRRHFW